MPDFHPAPLSDFDDFNGVGLAPAVHAHVMKKSTDFYHAFQFDPVLKAPNGREKLPRFMDPKLRDDYPLDSAWKVNFLKFC